MNIQSLKQSLTDVMPILDANLEAALEEWMAGDIPRGTFEYVRSRHLTAQAVVARDDIMPEDAFKACSLLAIDLRSGIKRVPVAPDASAKCEACGSAIAMLALLK